MQSLETQSRAEEGREGLRARVSLAHVVINDPSAQIPPPQETQFENHSQRMSDFIFSKQLTLVHR